MSAKRRKFSPGFKTKAGLSSLKNKLLSIGREFNQFLTSEKTDDI